MKTKYLLSRLVAILGSLLLLAVTLVACAQATPPPTVAPPTAIPSTPTQTLIPDTASEKCLFCHSIENIGMIVG